MPRSRAAVALLATILAAFVVGCGGARRHDAYPDAAVVEARILRRLPGGVVVHEGGFGSAIACDPNRPGRFYLLADRGPNVDTERGTEKRFVVPDYRPRIGHFALDGNRLRRLGVIELRDASGGPLSGIPPLRADDRREEAVDFAGAAIDPDSVGVDPEGLVALADGTFWVSEEYGPDLLHVGADGRTLERIGPAAANSKGRALPRVFASRRPNRGMEGLTVTPDGRTLVGIMQSALDNPSAAVRPTAVATRLLTFDLASGRTRQFVYVLDRPELVVSEIAARSATSFLVLERDNRFAGPGGARDAHKRVVRIDTAGATDVSDAADDPLGRRFGGRTLEELTAGELRAAGVVPVAKAPWLDLLALPGGYPHDKPEGLAIVGDHWLAISNDDDFGVSGGPDATVAQKRLPGAASAVDHNTVRFVRLD